MWELYDYRLKKKIQFSHRPFYEAYLGLSLVTKSALVWQSKTEMEYFYDKYYPLNMDRAVIAKSPIMYGWNEKAFGTLANTVTKAEENSQWLGGNLPIDLFYYFRFVDDVTVHNVKEGISWEIPKDMEDADKPNFPSRLMLNFYEG